jgi:ketosteroid isomerase-like protein
MMTSNEKVIHHFYTCFQNLDYRGMQQCYSEQATFSDEIFQNLNAKQVCAMWEMLLSKNPNITIKLKSISDNIDGGEAKWKATYHFSTTGKKVKNEVQSVFIIYDGKIIQQKDHFDFKAWARQAFGLRGLIYGWTSLFKHQVRRKAMSNLAAFMSRKSR